MNFKHLKFAGSIEGGEGCEETRATHCLIAFSASNRIIILIFARAHCDARYVLTWPQRGGMKRIYVDEGDLRLSLALLFWRVTKEQNELNDWGKRERSHWKRENKTVLTGLPLQNEWEREKVRSPWHHLRPPAPDRWQHRPIGDSGPTCYTGETNKGKTYENSRVKSQNEGCSRTQKEGEDGTSNRTTWKHRLAVLNGAHKCFFSFFLLACNTNHRKGGGSGTVFYGRF